MNDAALFAVSSVVPKELVLSTGFDIQLSRTIAEGELIARGRVIGTSEQHCLAEAVLVNGDGEELGRGGGAFVKTETPLSSDMGYA
jgi:acyl-coenzyme A thioesterase PaaI-like protein